MTFIKLRDISEKNIGGVIVFGIIQYGLTVAFIGMAVVFAGLILLVVSIEIMSVFCVGIDQKRKEKAARKA